MSTSVVNEHCVFAARFNVNVNAVLSANGIGDIVNEGSMYLHRLHVRLLFNLK